jgi:hypothetical protein
VKIIFSLACAGCLLAGTALASSPVTLTISNVPGYAIPDDFIGLSFETANVLAGTNRIPDAGKFYLFSPTNRTFIAFFKTVGIKNLRVGGGTVDIQRFPVPGPADIDQLFAFAKAADVKVIYSFRLLNGDPTNAAALAKYIWQHYRAQLDCFAIGNEPNVKSYRYPPFGTGPDPAITNYSSYLATWTKFADTITNTVPDAKFQGPDAAGWNWAGSFAKDEAHSGIVIFATQHEYIGGSPIVNGRETSVAAAIKNMLSENWVTNKCPAFFQKSAALVLAAGLPDRMTEANDYLRGVTNASDAYASALWALDYMHWLAARGVSGINFHNKEWLRTDTVFLDRKGICRINPKAYGLKAFDLGSHGRVEPVAISNPKKINLTAYAVRNPTNLFVTVINKGCGFFARKAKVTILPDVPPKKVEVMLMTGKVGAKTGITLGGAPIHDDGSWRGKWKSLKLNKTRRCAVKVPAASAAIVKFSFE